MEGKKLRVLCQDCRAVSEVYGQLLMISMVVIAFSGIALTVFSDGGAEKPEHTPHTDLQETINTTNNTLQIIHSGGEPIDLSAIKIILIIGGKQQPDVYEQNSFTIKKLEDSEPKNIFMLGDCIEIKDKNITGDVDIDMFFVDTPSQQVIQRVTLQCGNEGKEENSGTNGRYWITPYPDGTPTDTSGGWISTEAVNEIGDGIFTVYYPPSKNNDDPNSTAQVFDFNINTTKEGVSAPIHKVILKIVYSVNDGSYKHLALDISVAEPENWIRVDSDMTAYKHDFDAYEIDITPYVKTITDLEKFKARVVIVTQASENAKKKAWIDFLGIHVE
ncbi:type IV pilin N-terminal domain-containing protein [Methanosarcina sp. UBA411]|uniref:type IV pilin N-terminal domain-containing protein n=1 Tax=Methanosarcina sp. UBA411 TaxID=1915589 RepID=UPI0025F7DAA8|nr:type IV pilin N-terminal domain-containing protein [Methanosarcina sp. UBA411]